MTDAQMKVSQGLRQALKIIVAKKGFPDYETAIWDLIKKSGENGDVEKLMKDWEKEKKK